MVPNLQNGNVSIAGRVCLRSERSHKVFLFNVGIFELLYRYQHRYQPILTFYFEIPKYLILYVFETSFKVLILTCNN